VVNRTLPGFDPRSSAGALLNIKFWYRKVGKELKTDTEKSIPISVHPWLAS